MPAPTRTASATCIISRSSCHAPPIPRQPNAWKPTVFPIQAMWTAVSWTLLYFRDPLGQLMELACYKFDPPHGFTHADVLHQAHKIRVEADDYNIADKHIADALLVLVQKSTGTLSD